MDEVERVLERLRRIERLREDGTRAAELLDELRALVPEAEAWARAEGGGRARVATEKLRLEVEGKA